MTGRRSLFAAAAALVLALVIVLFGAVQAAGAEVPDERVDLYIFHLDTCPHCHAALEFLGELGEEYPQLAIHDYEVSSDVDARRLFVEMSAELGGDARAVPTIILGDRMWVGFTDSVAAELRGEVEARVRTSEAEPARAGSEESTLVDVPFLGEFDVGSSSLLVSTVVIALVDGVNPCSLWVLSILLALVLHSKSRRRVALVGTTFLFVTTALYGVYMVGAFTLLSYASYLPWIERGVAAIVAVFAFINLRDYFRDSPPTLAIPDTAKPTIYRRARALIAPDRSTLAVIAGTTALAAGVSLVETPCSAALPLLWTDLLASHEATTPVAVSLFAIYMTIFLVDELALFAAVVITMRATRLQERHGRALRLVTGSVMLCLAAVMLLDPTMLENLTGTLLVLAATIAVAAALAIVRRLVRSTPAAEAERDDPARGSLPPRRPGTPVPTLGSVHRRGRPARRRAAH